MQHANTGGGERLAGARLGTSRWDRPHDGAAPRRETETGRAASGRGGNAVAAQAQAERRAQIQQRRFWCSLFQTSSSSLIENSEKRKGEHILLIYLRLQFRLMISCEFAIIL
jgi:hypothetical protein